MTIGLFSRYAPYIAALPSRDFLTKDDLLVSTFLLHKENGLEIYYAPFDYVNQNAKIVLIGYTFALLEKPPYLGNIECPITKCGGA